MAIGLQCSGAFFSLAGVLGVGMVLVMFAWLAPAFLSDSGRLPPGFLGDMALLLLGSTACLLIGGFAFYAGRRLRRLDSLRWAYAACGLSIVFYPMCIVTLPLGIYGLFALRRADVRAVIEEQQAARRGTMPVDEPQPV